MPDSKFFFKTAASIADAAEVNHNGIRKLLVNGLSTFLIKEKPVFRNYLKSLSRYSSDYLNLDC